MKKLFTFLLLAVLTFSANSIFAQDQKEDNTISFKGYAYNEMRDVARGKKITAGKVQIFDEKGEKMLIEQPFTDVEPFIVKIEPEKTYMLKVFDKGGKLLKEGPFGASTDFYAKNEKLETGRWVPLVEGKKEYGLALFTATPKLPPTKYSPDDSSSSRSVGNMQLPDLMSSLSELRAFSW